MTLRRLNISIYFIVGLGSVTMLPTTSNAIECGNMEVFDVGMGMCMPMAMAEMPMKMLMLRGNGFFVETRESTPRGKSALSSPNMFMADLGSSVGSSHFLNLDFMGTIERWSMPYAGYPELLQIGETNSQGQPFIDAQHPHNSPIMGLTLSDTLSLQRSKDNLKLYFAPRGETTDGPIAFMHRPTGMINPDAPLGHHIGQDVGHVSSTVFGASLQLGDSHFEASTYNGTETKPDSVDLPLGTPNSISFRCIREFSRQLTGMISFARVSQPEPDQPDILFENRYSASLYLNYPLGNEWMFHNSLIYGLVTHYDQASNLSSFAEEFLFQGNKPRIWGRVEMLQRTPAELAINTATNPNQGHWVAALTLGYTHKLTDMDGAEIGLGASSTKNLLPGDFIGSYGGNPWSAKLFLQLGGMKMWDL